MLTDYKSKIVQIPLFQLLDEPIRRHLADILVSQATARVLEPGEVLYEKGAEDPATGAVLVEGTLSVTGEDDGAIDIAAPELVGEMQQFDPYGRRTATLAAKDAATVLEFAWHDFVLAILEDAEISREDQTKIKEAFQKYVGDRLKQLS